MSKTQSGNITELQPFDELEKDRQRRLQHEKELKSSEAEIDRHVKAAIEENPDVAFDEDRIKKLAEEKQKKRKERYDDWY